MNKEKKWIIGIGRKEEPYILTVTNLDVSEEELRLCILNQIYDEEWESFYGMENDTKKIL